MSGSGMSSASLQPTWYGIVTNTKDALVLFEACLHGILHHVPRRPHDRERSQLIRSGCVFIYEENASGIKRWTDGVPWSPSRILGNFLVYRELVKPFAPGEKKRATKKSQRPPRPEEQYNSEAGPANPSPSSPSQEAVNEARERERSLIGSLVDSYNFKEGGLVKKTMSVNVHGVYHHLVSYYRIEDVPNGLPTVTTDSRLAGIEPRSDLLIRQNWRVPVDEADEMYPEIAATQGQAGFTFQGQYGRPGMMSPASPTHPPPPGPLQVGQGSIPPPGHGLPPPMHGHGNPPVIPYPTYPQHSSPASARPPYEYQNYMGPSHPSDRSPSYSQAPHHYSYRQQPPAPSPTSSTGHTSAGANNYSSGSSPWTMPPPDSGNHPPPDSRWGYGGPGGYGGQNSYHGGPPSGQ